MANRNDILRNMTSLLNGTEDFFSAPVPPGFVPDNPAAAGIVAPPAPMPNLHNVAAEVANTLAYTPPVASTPVYPQASPVSPSVSISQTTIYEVRAKMENELKVFAVYNKTTESIIKGGLEIREAAEAIVKCLQRGYDMDSKRVQEIIELEETFFRNRSDAARFKSRYETATKQEEYKSAEVYETRFQVAKANAMVAVDQIKSILASFR